ncbi:hypothetical protein [Alkalibacillus haloalkaliphilus]|uniref:hypothetical protein n=1 Tax=Alkalibacillus haloalkaliphilus TaxID=94136 RepID=UPI0012FDC1B4|nr:hypothetical protein [Alkalibacillus haloalkaliphilus]
MKHPVLKKLMSVKACPIKLSPYDGIKLYSNNSVTQDFWNMIQPAKYIDTNITGTYYRYLVAHDLFVVEFGSRYSNIPETKITINPHTSSLTPIELLDLVVVILGDYKNVEVGSWDEQLDIIEYDSHEVAKRLW